MALNDALVETNREPDPSGDPAAVKLQSRWRSAVNKASTQLDAQAAYRGFDAGSASESGGGNAFETHFHDGADATPSPITVRDNIAPEATWRAVRASQVRKIDRRLARLQQAFLAPPICGHFHFNDQLVEWQLCLPQEIVNPVVARIGFQPAMMSESAEAALTDPTITTILPEREVVEPARFSIAIAAESFLLNWIPTPWKMLGNDAQHVLSQVAIAPLVDAVGLALREHWYVVGLEDRREVDGGAEGGMRGGNAHVLIGLNFRCADVAQKDTATLSVPEEWLENFLALRRNTTQVNSMRCLLIAHPGMADLLHTVPVVVGEFVLNVGEVEKLEMGDVFFFATHHGSLASFWNSNSVNARIDAPSAKIELTLDGEKSTAQVRKVSPRQVVNPSCDFVGAGTSGSPHFSYSVEAHEALMQNTPSSNTTAAYERSLSDHLATLPVAITVEVAELSMPLSALADIAVGTTLSLAKPLDEHLLTIRANGHPIAFGELVMLDNEVGVRVKRLSAPAMPISRVASVGKDGEVPWVQDGGSAAVATPAATLA